MSSPSGPSGSVNSSASRASQVLAIAIAFPVISTIAVALRIFTRVKIVKAMGSDDGLSLLALIFSWMLSATMVEQIHYGLGRHVYTLPPEMLIHSQKPFFFSIMAYNLTLTFTKSSIIFLYLRIFVGPRIRMACFIVLGFVIAYGIELFVAGIFTCTPVQFFWDKTIPGGTCINEKAAWYANAGINMVSDFVIILLPMPAIKKLNMPRRQKIGLMLILAVGLFTCITTIIRLWALAIVTSSRDPTWDNVGAASWSCIEANVGILCSCLPALKPLVNKLFPRLLGSSLSKSTGTSDSGPSQWTGKGNSSKGYMEHSFGQEAGHPDSQMKDGDTESQIDFGSQTAFPMTNQSRDRMEDVPYRGFAQ